MIANAPRLQDEVEMPASSYLETYDERKWTLYLPLNYNLVASRSPLIITGMVIPVGNALD
jgi:hypothetical protein